MTILLATFNELVILPYYLALPLLKHCWLVHDSVPIKKKTAVYFQCHHFEPDTNVNNSFKYKGHMMLYYNYHIVYFLFLIFNLRSIFANCRHFKCNTYASPLITIYVLI